MPERQYREQGTISAPDKRSAEREAYIESIRFSSGDSEFHGRSKDISPFGLFIETTAELEVGDVINVMLRFRSTPEPLQLSALVTRKTEKGIGALFEVLNQPQIKEIKSIITNHIDP